MVTEIKDRTIALLIDSDNVSQDYFTILLEELNKYGNVTYKRIYGDFTSKQANGWRPLLLQHAIEPIQQYAAVTGKNATDSAMIIDAMDILYSAKVDCFCLATSDSDFTKLATRFRNENYIVIGAGEQKTPQSFRKACHHFLLMDTLLKTNKLADKKEANNDIYKNYNQTPDGVLSLPELIKLGRQIIVENTDDNDGWMNYGNFYQQLCVKENSFNPRNYCGQNKRPLNFFRELPGKPFTLKVDGHSQQIRNSK